MVQNVVVALIVAAAVLFVARRFLPAAIRDPLLTRLAGAARAAHLPSIARRLDPARADAAGCGSGCGSCGGCDTAAARPQVVRLIPNSNSGSET